MFQAELWFRGLVSRPRSVACYRPRRQRSRQGSADATGRGRARGVFYLLSALCITNHHPPANRPAQARCPRLGLRLCAPPRRAKSSTNPPWSALSQPPGSACGGHYIDHPHQRPEGRFSAIHGEGGSLDCEISLTRFSRAPTAAQGPRQTCQAERRAQFTALVQLSSTG